MAPLSMLNLIAPTQNLVDTQKFLPQRRYLKREQSNSQTPIIGILFVQHSLFAFNLSIFDLIHFLVADLYYKKLYVM